MRKFLIIVDKIFQQFTVFPCKFGSPKVKQVKLLCNFIEITLQHGCSPGNLLHVFRTPFPKNTSRMMLLFAIFTGLTLTKDLKFSIKDFFSKCDQIRRKLQIWSHLLKKSLIENFDFCAEKLNQNRSLLVFFIRIYISIFHYFMQDFMAIN